MSGLAFSRSDLLSIANNSVVIFTPLLVFIYQSFKINTVQQQMN